MDMNDKNAQPSMEEILASIRRIIAEEPAEPAALNPQAKAVAQDGSQEEGQEFELPSMFRASAQPAAEKPAPLFGRLTDAIRSAQSGGAGDGRSASAMGAELDALARAHAAQGGATGSRLDVQQSAYPSLSSLKAARIEPQASQKPATEAPAADPMQQAAFPMPQAPRTEDVKRVMAPFKDTRFARMSDGVPQTAAPLSNTNAQAFAAPQRAQSVFDADPFAAQMSPPPLGSSQAMTGGALQDAAARGGGAGPEATAGSGAIEDTTAELLRPMLRQWLSDNMPRMVEKALHIEVAESVKTGKKPTLL